MKLSIGHFWSSASFKKHGNRVIQELKDPHILMGRVIRDVILSHRRLQPTSICASEIEINHCKSCQYSVWNGNTDRIQNDDAELRGLSSVVPINTTAALPDANLWH